MTNPISQFSSVASSHQRKAERSLRKAVREAETSVLLRQNNRIQEKLFSLHKQNQLFEARRAPEDTRGRGKHRTQFGRCAKAKKEPSGSQKVVLPTEFNVLLGNIESHPQNTSHSRHWRVACCKNRRVKKWSYTCKKGVELDTLETQFRF